MFFANKKKRIATGGFTLIELLIVIAVIGILAVGIIIGINPVRQLQKARDATRKSDIHQIVTALETQYTFTSQYPPFDVPPESAPYGHACIRDNNVGTLIRSGAIRTIPLDPTTRAQCPCFLYINNVSTNGSGYTLFARLENPQDELVLAVKPTPNIAPNMGTYNNTTFTITNGTCNGFTFNYWVNSR